MTDVRSVTVEFLGIPRQRAGRAELVVAAGSIAEILAAIERSCPDFTDLKQADGQLAHHYVLSLDGSRFLRDLSHALGPGDRLLVMSADAGG